MHLKPQGVGDGGSKNVISPVVVWPFLSTGKLLEGP